MVALVPAILLFVIAITVEIYKYYYLVKKTSKIDNFKLSRQTVLIGRYYDNITPAAIGGQPFQIFFMTKNGVKNGYGTAIPLVGMIAGQIGFFIIASLCFLFGSLTINNAAIVAAGCFGLIFYAFFPIAILVATFLPKTTSEIIGVGVKFLSKLHIIKDKEKALEKTEKSIAEYSGCVKTILKTRGLFLKSILFSVVFHLLFYSIPFFVLSAFDAEIDFIPCFVTTIAVTAAVYFIPTPGNAGAAEGAFFIVFSALSSGYIFWAMLIWRFFSYYIFIILGLINYAEIYFKDKNILKNWQKQEKENSQNND